MRKINSANRYQTINNNKMKVFQNLTLGFILLFVSSCNKCTIKYSSKKFDNAPRKTISIGDITAIENTSTLQINYRQSKNSCLVIEGDTSKFECLKFSISNSKLYFKFKDGNYEDLWLRVTVYAPNVNEFSSKSGSLLLNSIKTDYNLIFDCREAGAISANSVKCSREIEIKNSDAGAVILENIEANKIMIRQRDAGYISAKAICSKRNIDILNSDAGTININCKSYGLYVTNKGSGNVNGTANYKYKSFENEGIGSVYIRKSESI